MECEIPQFYSTETRKARKSYPCVECLAPIDVGEEYLICKGKWDGTFSYWRQHLLCAETCMLIRDEFNDECIGFGELFDWWGEHSIDIRGGAKNERCVLRQDCIKLRSMIARIIQRERAGKRTK